MIRFTENKLYSIDFLLFSDQKSQLVSDTMIHIHCQQIPRPKSCFKASPNMITSKQKDSNHK